MVSPPVIASRIDEIAAVDPTRFDGIVAAYRPVVMRGLVAHWPAVVAARDGNRPLVDYLGRLDSGAPTTFFQAPPEDKGRFFYAPDMRGLNFTTGKTRLPITPRRLRSMQCRRRPRKAGAVSRARTRHRSRW